MRIICVAVFVLCVAGCGGGDALDVEKSLPASREASGVELAADGFTGKAHIDAMKKSEKRVNDISSEHDRKLQEQIDEE